MFPPPHVAYWNRIRPGRKKAGRRNGQSALGPMCDVKKDWQERYFRTSGAINFLATRSRWYPDSLYRTRGTRCAAILFTGRQETGHDSATSWDSKIAVRTLRFVADFFFVHSWETAFKNSQNLRRIRQIQVGRNLIGRANVVDSKISRNAWTGPDIPGNPDPIKNSMDIFATKGDLFHN